jgi:hypothetical protein
LIVGVFDVSVVLPEDVRMSDEDAWIRIEMLGVFAGLIGAASSLAATPNADRTAGVYLNVHIRLTAEF